MSVEMWQVRAKHHKEHKVLVSSLGYSGSLQCPHVCFRGFLISLSADVLHSFSAFFPRNNLNEYLRLLQ